MTEREKMLSGELYNSLDSDLLKRHNRAVELCMKLNSTFDAAEREKLSRELIGKAGKNLNITPDFWCDYGENIEVGDNFYTNYGVVILDVCKVTIGNNCLIAPQVGIYTAYHPLDRDLRKVGEYGKPITIGNDCWIGGNAVINPGVTLGDNVVVGSGAVVTRSFGSGVVIAGNPAKIIRYL